MARARYKSVDLVPRTDNQSIDARFPDGVVTPEPPQIFIAEIPPQTLTAGTAYSVDFSTFVTGADAPGATYSMTVVSGSALATLDLTFTGSTLAGATPDAGSAVLRLTVTKLGIPFLSNSFLCTVNPVVLTDDQAPAVPIRPNATVNSTVQIALSGSHSMDVQTATAGASGLDAMILQRCTVTGGVDGTYTDRTTISTANGFTGLHTQTTIGTPSGSPTITQTGANYALSSGLGTLGTTSDSVKWFHWQITGDFELIGTMADFSHGDDPFAASILMARASLDANSVYYRGRRWSQASLKGISVAKRLSTGSSVTNGVAVTANIPADAIMIIRRITATDTFTLSFIDTAGVEILVDTSVVVMPATIFVGGCGIRSSAGTNVSFAINNVILNTLGLWTFNDTTIAATSYRYKVKARDNASNVSALSNGTPILTTPGAAVGFKRIHRGYYMLLNSSDLSEARITEHLGYIAQLTNEPNVRGVKLTMAHGRAEGAMGNYSGGFAIVDRYLKACKAAGNKKLMLSIFKNQFNTLSETDQHNGRYFPTYITENPTVYGLTSFTFGGHTERVWQAATMDRWIAMSQAYAARYENGVVLDDGHTHYLEVYQTGETAIPVALNTNGYTIAAWTTQLSRLINASADAWPHTLMRVAANFLSASAMPQIIALCKSRKCGVGGPDIIAKESIEANRFFSGYTGGIDYRGQIPWIIDMQDPEMGGKDGDLTMAQAVACSNFGISIPPGLPGVVGIPCTHMVIARKEWNQGPTGGIRWNNPRLSDGAESILSYIRGHAFDTIGGQNTCPTEFDACDVSG